jgi:hypothetical protein
MSKLVVLVACGLIACGPAPGHPRPITDAGSDSSRPRDAALLDAGADAGPPADPVLPTQAWQVSFFYNDFAGARSINASVLVDARAESGSVRTVIGANGRASNVVFDIPTPGTLVGRGPIELGPSIPISNCANTRIVRVVSPVLTFSDRDGDGIFERLGALSGEVFVVDAFGNASDVGPPFSVSIEPDTAGPMITPIPAHPVPAFETLHLFANEPLDPSILPYVEAGGRVFALYEVPGSGASHWSLDLSTLPIGTGYALRFESELRDLAGNPAVAAPELTFDVATPTFLAPDGFETSLEGIVAEDGVRTLTGDEGPLVGSTSAFSTSRTVVAFMPARSATTISFQYRLHSETMMLGLAPWLRVRAPDGRVLAETPLSGSTYLTGTVAGFPFQSDPMFGQVFFPAGGEALTLEILIHGTDDPSCSGTPTTPLDVPLGITLDAFETH